MVPHPSLATFSLIRKNHYILHAYLNLFPGQALPTGLHLTKVPPLFNIVTLGSKLPSQEDLGYTLKPYPNHSTDFGFKSTVLFGT